METKGFYKVEDGGLLYAPNFVAAPDYELRAELHETYTYPVEGWRWFESEEAAREFYGIEEE